jgi:hypothetical protein
VIDHGGTLGLDGCGEASPVTLTILYRHSKRPDEAGMAIVADKEEAVAMKDQLEKQGFVVTKITTTPLAKAISSS